MEKGDVLVCIKEVSDDVVFHYRGNTYDEEGYIEHKVYYEKGEKYSVECNYDDDRWDSSPIVTVKRPIKDAVELGFLELSRAEGGLHVAEETGGERGELGRDLDGFGVYGLHDEEED